jgi:hypothetical protein
LFVQLPGLAVSVCPWVLSPEIAGAVVLDGGSGSTVAVGAESAGGPLPPALVAVTCTSIVSPTSDAVTV